jgi:hypothetical protein
MRRDGIWNEGGSTVAGSSANRDSSGGLRVGRFVEARSSVIFVVGHRDRGSGGSSGSRRLGPRRAGDRWSWAEGRFVVRREVCSWSSGGGEEERLGRRARRSSREGGRGRSK